MKKSILQIGSALSKAQQKSVRGGLELGPGGHSNIPCTNDGDCPPNPIPGAPYMCDTIVGFCLYAY